MRTQKKKKCIIAFLGVILLFGGISLHSRLLSEEVSISLENFVYCQIQVMREENNTGIGRAVQIRDIEKTEKLFDFLGSLKARKMLPWETIFAKKIVERTKEHPYMIILQYDSEMAGRSEGINCWTTGQVDIRGTSYILIEEPKTRITDYLELLLQTNRL
mgnify:CR=1 FL=1